MCESAARVRSAVGFTVHGEPARKIIRFAAFSAAFGQVTNPEIKKSFTLFTRQLEGKARALLVSGSEIALHHV